MAFSDNFVRANEALEASANWTTTIGGGPDVTIVSNECTFLGVVNREYKCPDQGDADHYVQVKNLETNSKSYFFGAVRLTDATNFFGVRYFGARYELYKVDTGAFTLLGNYVVASSGSDIVYLEASGNNITVKIDGTTRIGPVSDAFNNTETGAGIVSRADAGGGIDYFINAGLTAVPSVGSSGFMSGFGTFGKLGA